MPVLDSGGSRSPWRNHPAFDSGGFAFSLAESSSLVPGRIRGLNVLVDPMRTSVGEDNGGVCDRHSSGVARWIPVFSSFRFPAVKLEAAKAVMWGLCNACLLLVV
ncbi:hypothetical protein F2Q70_00002547 [Brassica cretica]|uniref:Uncharacterized protein n=1 Tax=Brassica cretica TaxID=69181 RepID=A0A8S9IWD5_BRACR|nr:hypothetical protein F2Q70_00002547 [Brassica cretica]